MSFTDFFRVKVPLTSVLSLGDIRPYLNSRYVHFSLLEREVRSNIDQILIDTGARVCVLDTRTMADLVQTDFQLLEDYLYYLLQLPPPSPNQIVPNFGTPFSSPQFLRGFGRGGRWAISLDNVKVIIRENFNYECTFYSVYNARPILGMTFLEKIKLILDRNRTRQLVLFKN